MAGNDRTFQAYHGGDTATAENINGVDNGGLMSAAIQFGKDRISRGSGDNQAVDEVNQYINFVRGVITTQDWPDIITLMDAALAPVGTYGFYEKESGLATVNINTITKPVIHQASFSLSNFSPAQITYAFECRATLVDDTIADMWTRLAAQDAPAAVLTTNRGDQITACVHGASDNETTVAHVTGLTFDISGNLIKGEPGDGDAAYMAVDVAYPYTIGGTLTMQELTTAMSLAEQTVSADGYDLVLTINQMSAAAAKTLTIKNVLFTNNSGNLGQSYAGYTMNWVCNSPSTIPLTLATAITIA